MPFRVKFDIYQPGTSAPVFTSYDRHMTRVEYNDCCRKAPLTRLVFDIELHDLTKSERYVWLVYRVRKAIHRYYNYGRKREDLLASLALESELDQWNLRTRLYIDNHPNAQVDEKGKAFFLLVEAWRERWHKYFASKKSGAVDKQVLAQMKKECLEYEKQIDKYVKQVIGLI